MAAAQHGNGYDPDRTRQCVDRIEAIARKKENAHMAYMADCSVFAEDTKAVYDEAKSAWGIPTRALKTVIKARLTERKLAALRDKLEGDDQESFDQIRHALGDLADTPLGEAATSAKKKGGGKASTGALNAAAGGGDSDAEQNAARLNDGISQLHS